MAQKEDRDEHLTYLEWEGLNHNWNIALRGSPRGVPKGTTHIVLNRGDDYRITGEMHVVSTDPPELDAGEPASRLSIPFQMRSRDFAGVTYWLSTFYVHKVTVTGAKVGRKGVSIVHITGVNASRKAPGRHRVFSVTEWYLNGPHDKGVYTTATSRSKKETYSRERIGVEGSASEVSLSVSNGWVVDCIVVKLKKIKFAIFRVPDGTGPSWSKSIGVEYRREWGGLPNHELRAKISEIVGFVLGRQLMNVGYTEYGDMGELVSQVVTEPLLKEASSICREMEVATLHLDPRCGGQDAGEVLSQLVEPYLRLEMCCPSMKRSGSIGSHGGWRLGQIYHCTLPASSQLPPHGLG